MSVVKRILDWLIVATGLGVLVWYLSGSSAELQRLDNLSLDALVLVSAMVLLGHVILAAKLLRSVTLFRARLTLPEALLLVEGGSFLNIVPMNLGTALRARYLKKVSRLKYVNYGLSFVGTQSTGFLAAGLMGLIFLSRIPGRFDELELAFFGYVLFAACMLILGYVARSTGIARSYAEGMGIGWWSGALSSLDRGIDEIVSQWRVVVLWFTFDIFANLVLGIRFAVVGMALGYDVGLAEAMVMQAVTRVAAVFIVVPSGTIGVREGLAGMASSGLGGPAVEGVMIATVDRVIATAWIVVLGSVSVFMMRRRIAHAKGEAIS